jgi:hypothetical protein
MKEEKGLGRATKARQAGETKEKDIMLLIGQEESNTMLVNPLNWSIILNLVASINPFSPIIYYTLSSVNASKPWNCRKIWHLLSSIHVAFASLQTFDPLICCSKHRFGS